MNENDGFDHLQHFAREKEGILRKETRAVFSIPLDLNYYPLELLNQKEITFKGIWPGKRKSRRCLVLPMTTIRMQ